MAVPRLSPGRLTALWVILRGMEQLGDGVSPTELQAFARRSGLRSGGLPIADGYQLAIAGDFIIGEDSHALSRLGREALARCTDEEPSHDVLRLFTSVLFLRHPPAWVAYWQGDPKSLEYVLPEPAREILGDAELFPPPDVDDLEAWAWWDALKQVPPMEATAGIRKAIGDAAEELTFAFEQERLRNEGLPALADRVRWVARESPAYGFDVLSFCGKAVPKYPAEKPLAIEVKGMAIARRDNFAFYLTDHEWRTAQKLGDRYVLHFWDGVRPGTRSQARTSGPFVIAAGALLTHLPGASPCGELCRWQSAFVALPVEA